VVARCTAPSTPLTSVRFVQLRTRIAELERLVYVPGVWRCPKCQFSPMRTALNVVTGRASADDTTGEKCPNCKSPLERSGERRLSRRRSA